MELLQCQTCGGVYRTVQADGTLYFHACPDRKVVGTTPAPTEKDPNAVAPVYQVFAQRRDENVTVTKNDDGLKASRAAGTKAVTDPAIIASMTGAN